MFVLMSQFRMESYQKESMRRIRRNSKTLLQDLFYRGVHGGGRDTPVSVSDPCLTVSFTALLMAVLAALS